MSASINLTPNRDDRRTLVVVFLRGAADGLTLVAPVADDNYHKFRPRLAVKKSDAVLLDDTFGLHPNLRPLEAAWKEGDLAIIHGAGGESDTRSHFEAQDLMEHGGVAAGGWLARFLRSRGQSQSPLAAVALAPTLPESLSGAPSAAAFESLREFAITDGRKGAHKQDFTQQVQRLYAMQTGPLRSAAASTFEALQRIEAIDVNATAENGASYDAKYPFSQGLRQIAQLIRAGVGLDAASIDLGGWDTHFTQQTTIEPLMLQLANGLAGFRRDLGPRMATTTVVVMTEFGRRVAENSGLRHRSRSWRRDVRHGMWRSRQADALLGGWARSQARNARGPWRSAGLEPTIGNVLAPILARHGSDLGRPGASLSGLRVAAAAALFLSDAATSPAPAADAQSAPPNPPAVAPAYGGHFHYRQHLARRGDESIIRGLANPR